MRFVLVGRVLFQSVALRQKDLLVKIDAAAASTSAKGADLLQHRRRGGHYGFANT